jgi:hypothetical protein
LSGAKAIATFTGLNERQIYHIASKGELPIFTFNGKLHARRSSLLRGIQALEEASGPAISEVAS